MNIDNKYVNYIDFGNKKGSTLVLLHGWGQNIEMMMPIGNAFKKEFRVIIVDLPGFGKSDEPTVALDPKGYAEVIHKLLTNLNIDNPILIGHSFGGTISIMYASMYNVRKLILFGSPYSKSKKSIKVKLLKTLKTIPVLNKLERWAKNNMGSTDYKNASRVMKDVLVKRVNADLIKEASLIKCPTLLIWGRNDTAVPVSEAEKLSKIIKDAGLVIYERGTHYAYLEDLQRTINILDKFFERENENYYED